MISIHSVPGAFSLAECDAIVAISRAADAKDAKLVGQNRDHDIRRADLVWLDEVEGTDWVMERIIEVVREANREVYDFALTEFAESPQVARYGSERKGHFDWHSDIGEGVIARQRKLTMVAQLSEPGDYEGGALEVWPSNAILAAPRDRGTLTFFPSYLLHRVTPVTAGERFSLTQWAHGPSFR
jgi:PKHD-type hydroxylase